MIELKDWVRKNTTIKAEGNATYKIQLPLDLPDGLRLLGRERVEGYVRDILGALPEAEYRKL